MFTPIAGTFRNTLTGAGNRGCRACAAQLFTFRLRTARLHYFASGKRVGPVRMQRSPAPPSWPRTSPRAKPTTAASGTAGYYEIKFVKAGTYTITAQQPASRRMEKTGVIVETNHTVRTDFTMEIGPYDPNHDRRLHRAAGSYGRTHHSRNAQPKNGRGDCP